MRLFPAVFLLAVILVSCAAVDPRAESVVDQFYSNLADQTYEANLPLFSKAYNNVTTPDQTLKLFRLVNGDVGTPTDYSLESWSTVKSAGTQGTTTTVRASYLVNATRGTTTDKFMLVRYGND